MGSHDPAPRMKLYKRGERLLTQVVLNWKCKTFRDKYLRILSSQDLMEFIVF